MELSCFCFMFHVLNLIKLWKQIMSGTRKLLQGTLWLSQGLAPYMSAWLELFDTVLPVSPRPPIPKVPEVRARGAMAPKEKAKGKPPKAKANGKAPEAKDKGKAPKAKAKAKANGKAMSRSGARKTGTLSSYQIVRKELEKEKKKRRRQKKMKISLQKDLKRVQGERDQALEEKSRLGEILASERENFMDEVHVAVRHRLAQMGLSIREASIQMRHRPRHSRGMGSP